MRGIYVLFANLSLVLTAVSALSVGILLIIQNYFAVKLTSSDEHIPLQLIYLLFLVFQSVFELFVRAPYFEQKIWRAGFLTIGFALPWFFLYQDKL